MRFSGCASWNFLSGNTFFGDVYRGVTLHIFESAAGVSGKFALAGQRSCLSLTLRESDISYVLALLENAVIEIKDALVVRTAHILR